MKKSNSTLKRIFFYLKPYRLSVIASVACSALSAAAMLLFPIYVGKLIDSLIGVNQVDFNLVTKYSLIMAGIAVASALFVWLTDIVNNHIIYNVVRDVREDAMEKLLTLPLSYIDSHPFGDTVSRVIADVDTFADGLLLGFSQLFSGVVTIFCTIGFMISLQAWIALVVIVLTPLSILTSKYFASKTHKRFKEQAEISGEETAIINEAFSNHEIVKGFSYDKKLDVTFNEVNDRLEVSSRFATFFSALTNPVTRFINSIVYAAVVAFGAYFCIKTKDSATPFTVGNLSALLAYANKYTKPFNDISGVITEMQNSFACANRVFELIDQKPESDKSDALQLNAPEGDISFDNVAFSYDKEVELIKDLSLKVKKGMRVAIVGPTGCGKTTLINLLMRFYDLDEGGIYIDGVNTVDYTRKSLRLNFGMVLQETWLKQGTIKENIAFGNPHASDEEIINASKTSHAHPFISRMENGYDTIIGEDGGSLSSGQKQLLCISRVMLKMPPLLILDEATSSIDTRTEMKIQDAFQELSRGKTTFIVAHRLSTIKDADLILVMNGGKIIETGKHQELLEQKGFYYQLWNSMD